MSKLLKFNQVKIFFFVLLTVSVVLNIRLLTNQSLDIKERENKIDLKNSEGWQDQVKGEKAAAIGENSGLSELVEETSKVLVTKVIDGDTIVIEGGEVVRYIGIDTPENPKSKRIECFAQEAFEKNKELVEGKLVKLEKDISERDRYSRLLRYVWVDNTFINDYLVREGYATAVSYPPDVKYQERFTQAEQQAREANKGLWSNCESGDQSVGQGAAVQPAAASIAQPSSVDSLNFNCSSNIYNCPDFTSQAQAQKVLEVCGITTDIHRLDRDKDGVACESLP